MAQRTTAQPYGRRDLPPAATRRHVGATMLSEVIQTEKTDAVRRHLRVAAKNKPPKPGSRLQRTDWGSPEGRGGAAWRSSAPSTRATVVPHTLHPRAPCRVREPPRVDLTSSHRERETRSPLAGGARWAAVIPRCRQIWILTLWARNEHMGCQLR